jgi:hypothetical protein
MCLSLSETNSAYLARVSERIVRMYERYIQNVNPDDERFKSFMSDYVAQRGVKDPQAVSYSELYRIIKEGIREYLKQGQPGGKK